MKLPWNPKTAESCVMFCDEASRKGSSSQLQVHNKHRCQERKEGTNKLVWAIFDLYLAAHFVTIFKNQFSFLAIKMRFTSEAKKKIAWKWSCSRQTSGRSGVSSDHLLLDSVPNLGPVTSRWEINKVENCWYKSGMILEVLKLLFQQSLNLSSFQRDMSSPILGTLSINRWLRSSPSGILIHVIVIRNKSTTSWSWGMNCHRDPCCNLNEISWINR